ncbi:MAG: alpha-hydroxy-acid oxidizing protein, partial [Acidobacterium ailaaui]|nr:alpha-hydroxy-acid oxidizing protein [Pseudacidobacterium ailaaui]
MLRDIWKRKLVIKGLAHPEDVDTCIQIGLDGIIVSNHGGRQLDAGPSSIHSLQE